MTNFSKICNQNCKIDKKHQTCAFSVVHSSAGQSRSFRGVLFKRVCAKNRFCKRETDEFIWQTPWKKYFQQKLEETLLLFRLDLRMYPFFDCCFPRHSTGERLAPVRLTASGHRAADCCKKKQKRENVNFIRRRRRGPWRSRAHRRARDSARA